jgi:phosphomannomutase
MGNLAVVASQAQPDPDFPTVAFPNPEEAGATDALLALAQEINADIAIANDPDADRCAMGARDHDGNWRLLRGDEVGALLGWWTIKRAEVFATPAPTGTFAASIVSATLLESIASKHGLKYQSTLTGFKWIAKISDLCFGYEEALGYCVDADSVRDKDGISAALRLAELAAWLKANSTSVAELLDDIAREYGLHQTDQLSVRMSNLADIPAAVNRLRTAPPTQLGGRAVTLAFDLKDGFNGLPPTDGYLLQLEGGRVIVRPSGTEPKLKCYLEVVVHNSDVAAAKAEALATLAAVKQELAAVLGL